MKNKVLVKLKVPEIDETYDLYLPINKKIGDIILLLNKAVNEMSDNKFKKSTTNVLFNSYTGEKYQPNITLVDTDIRNGTELTLLS